MSDLLKDIPIHLFDRKRVLITGATGLVGTHLLYAFNEMHNMGIRVVVVAPLHRSVPNHLKFLAHSGFVQFGYSMSYSDIIIHAATYAQPAKFMNEKAETIKLNTTVTNNLLENYLKPGGKFLFLSSSEVYSGLNNPPFIEEQIGTTNPMHPRACYIESKRCGETIVNAYRDSGVDAKSVRLCLAYGEGTRRDDQRAMSVFIRKALVDKKIDLMDDGSAVRTYCYIGDAVNMILRILLEGKRSTYNIGGRSATTISGLVNMIGQMTGARIVMPQNNHSCIGAPTSVSLTNKNYIEEFGNREFVSFEAGLAKTIEYNKKLYHE